MNEAFCVDRQNLEKVCLLKMWFGLSNPKLLQYKPQYNHGRAKGLATFVRYNEVSFIEILFQIFYYYWGKKKNCSLYRGLRYIEVPLQLLLKQ